MPDSRQLRRAAAWRHPEAGAAAPLRLEPVAAAALAARARASSRPRSAPAPCSPSTTAPTRGHAGGARRPRRGRREATFFVLGRHVTEQPELVAGSSRRGTRSPCTGWTTAATTCSPRARPSASSRAGVEAIETATGRRPAWYRPPFGASSPTLAAACDEARPRARLLERLGPGLGGQLARRGSRAWSCATSPRARSSSCTTRPATVSAPNAAATAACGPADRRRRRGARARPGLAERGGRRCRRLSDRGECCWSARPAATCSRCCACSPPGRTARRPG